MEPDVETFCPWRLYARTGWGALACSLVCLLCGFRAPLAFVPAGLCVATAAALFWLARRPLIRIRHSQFNIGERAIAWREVREINRTRLLSPLVLDIRLTNSRRRVLIYPGEPDRIASLVTLLRRYSTLASFDGVPYRDFCSWQSTNAITGGNPSEEPVRMLTEDDEEEIERLYQKLKTVGRLDSHGGDVSSSRED